MNVDTTRNLEEVTDTDTDIELNEEISELDGSTNELEGLLDLLGALGGYDEKEYAAEKEAVLESGISAKDFGMLLGQSLGDKFGPREIQSVHIQKLTETAQLPLYAHPTDACADIFADETITINPGETKLVKTGIAMAIPVGFVVHIFPRSGLSLKTPLRLSNSVGVIDSEYRDEVKGIFTNIGTEPYTINQGDRIMQMSIDHSPMARFKLVDDIHQIDGDRNGGFGSTGMQQIDNNSAEESDGQN